MDIEILPRIQPDRIPICEIFQAFGYFCRHWHASAQDEDRNDRGIFAQRCLDLYAYRVILIGNSALRLRSRPLRSDNSKHDIARTEDLIDMGPEIYPDRDIVDIAEDL